MQKFLFKNDYVVMHSCLEAKENDGKIWICSCDSWLDENDNELVFLDGFSGSFHVKYLQKINQENYLKPIFESIVNNGWGLSAKAITFRMLNSQLKEKYTDHPYDCWDFSRCYSLLKAMPQWRGRLAELRKISLTWNSLVTNWNQMEEAYEKEDYNRVSDIIKFCLNNSLKNQL